jgi:HPt (histidine-containing phosphotransfer) domain-containing protein
VSKNMPLFNDKVLAQLKGLSKGEDDTFLAELCERFVGNAVDTLKNIKAAAEQEDSNHLARLAHRLNGSALNVGAVKVATVCLEIEQRALKGLVVSEDKIAELELVLTETRESLSTALLSPSKSK